MSSHPSPNLEAADRRELPVLVVAARLWRRTLPVVLPAVAAAYGVSLSALALQHSELGEDRVGAAIALGLHLAASWLGQLWVGAAALSAAADRPVSLRAAWRQMTAAGGRAWLHGLLRAAWVYWPLPLLGWVFAMSASRTEVGQPNFAPLAVLLLVPLTINLAALFSLTAPVALVERPRSIAALLTRAKAVADSVFLGVLGWGGLVTAAALLTSILPIGRGLWLPNHLLGSLVWVLLAALYVRARELEDERWGPEQLAVELEAGPAR